MMLTLSTAITLLQEENLLREFIYKGEWHFKLPKNEEETYRSISYDSRKAKADGLFICKGLNFKEAYLHSAIEAGCLAYVAEKSYDIASNVTAIIVNDIQKAMAVLARAFYDYPDQKLTLIGYTGTKGKTTSVYMTYHILEQAYPKQIGRLTSIDNVVGPNHVEVSQLTTPESIDLYRLLHECVENGVKKVVVEVSSQAYKLQRVYGLMFDIGVFLNISPDHIGGVEHPTFDDYMDCKAQLFHNSRCIVMNANSVLYPFMKQKVKDLHRPLITYGNSKVEADYTYCMKNNQTFELQSHNASLPHMNATFTLKMPGDFNQHNAVSAIITCLLLNVSLEDLKVGLANTSVPGRMEKFEADGKVVYVDYAHNYLSVKQLLSYIHDEYPNSRVSVVVASYGSRGSVRREGVGKAISEEANRAYITSGDDVNDDPNQLMDEIIDSIDSKQVEITKESDRIKAIEKAIGDAKKGDVVIVAGKGNERVMHRKGKAIPYEGDANVVRRLLGEE